MPDRVDAVDLKAAVAALRSDGVYVAPSLAEEVPASDRASLTTTIRGHQPAIYVLAVPASSSDQAQQIATAAHRAMGGPGVYFVSRRDGQSWDLQAVKFDVVTNGRDVQATFEAFDAHPRDLGAQLKTAVTAFTSDRATTTATAESAARGDAYGGFSPVLISVPVVLVAFVAGVVWWMRRARRRVVSTGQRRRHGQLAKSRTIPSSGRGHHRR